MANAQKKVVLRTSSNETVAGYLPGSGFVELREGAPVVDLLAPDGRILSFQLDTVRSIAFVRDFNLGDRDDPERMLRKTFLARPRSEGLWVRLTLTGGEILEGLAPLDLALADSLVEDRGLLLTPPDIRSNTQRIFIPRTAMLDLQVLAVITTPSKVRAVGPKRVPPGEQPDQADLLFPDAVGRR